MKSSLVDLTLDAVPAATPDAGALLIGVIAI
jgi:hypothetical protein